MIFHFQTRKKNGPRYLLPSFFVKQIKRKPLELILSYKMCHFHTQNGQLSQKKSFWRLAPELFALNENFFLVLMYFLLMAPFVVQIFKKILTVDPVMTHFLCPKCAFAPKKNLLEKTIMVIPFHINKFKISYNQRDQDVHQNILMFFSNKISFRALWPFWTKK